ncbi:uncharacterized protein LOC144161776 [Haemaphysalis longicornis]
MKAPEEGGRCTAAPAEMSVKRIFSGRGRGKVPPSVSPGVPTSPLVQPPALSASTASAFSTASNGSPIGRGRARCALLRAAEMAARPPQPSDEKQEVAAPPSEAASAMNATENANTACEMPDQRPEGTRTAAVVLPGSSTGLVEEGQSPRPQEVCPSTETDKKYRGDQPKRDQAEGTTTGDDKGILLGQPSLDPDDLRRKRGQTGEAVEDDGKIALLSQLSQANLDPDGLSRERHQAEHTATDEDALSSKPCFGSDDPSNRSAQVGDTRMDDVALASQPNLDPDGLSSEGHQAECTATDEHALSSQPCLGSDDPSNRSAQVGDTTMDDVALASPPNLDPDDQSCQHQQAENSMLNDDKIPVSSRHSLDSDDPSEESEQAWDTTTSDDNITLSGKPSLDPDDPSHQRDEDQLLDLPQCEVIARKATSVPDSLTSVEMEELVRAICQKAAEDSENAWPAANLCLSIIAKQPKPKFIDCLLRSCEEWFEHRAERLPRSTRKGSVWWKRQQREGAGAVAAGPSWKWTAYVAFVAELLVAVTGTRVRTPVGTRRFSTTRERAYCLAMLLCDCCQETLRFPAQDVQDMQEEVDCLRAALTLAGGVADLVAPDRMDIMFHWLRASCFDHQFSPDARDVTREIANLRCLGWKKAQFISATMRNIVMMIIWLLLLVFLSFFVAGLGFILYVIVSVFSPCVPALRDLEELFMRGVTFPHQCSANMVDAAR